MLRNSKVSYRPSCLSILPSFHSSSSFHTHHFKTKTSVNHQKDQINHFSHINHRVDIVVAFDKRQSSLFAYPSYQLTVIPYRNHIVRTADNGDGTFDLCKVVFGVSFDKRFDQCRFAALEQQVIRKTCSITAAAAAYGYTYSRWSNDCNNYRWCFNGRSIHQWHMELLFTEIEIATC